MPRKLKPVKDSSSEAQEPVSDLANIDIAMKNFNLTKAGQDQRELVSFEAFLMELSEKPTTVMRNIFQMFFDMVQLYVGEGEDEYPDDPESINYACYDCTKLFVEGSDHPFFCRPFVRQPSNQPGGGDEARCPAK